MKVAILAWGLGTRNRSIVSMPLDSARCECELDIDAVNHDGTLRL